MDLFAKGWVCPKCGAVMPPTTSCCVNCTGIYEVYIATNYTPATDAKGHPLFTNDKGSFNFQKNDMPRYYESESLIDFVKQNTPHINGETTMECVERAIQKAPTADVVPKSEYDAVVSAVDNSTKEFLKLHDKYQEQKAEIERLTIILDSYALQYGTVTSKQAVIDKAKDDVAREIFEEIEKAVENAELEWGTIFGVKLCIAELKKKYTEGE